MASAPVRAHSWVGEYAEPAVGAPDQDAVAGLEPAAVDQHPVSGEVRQPVRRSLLPGQVLGLVEQLLSLDFENCANDPQLVS